MARLKQWMIERDTLLLKLIKKAEETERRSDGMFGLSEEDERYNARIDRDIAILEGERRGNKEAYDALNRFAIHPFVEEPSETSSHN